MISLSLESPNRDSSGRRGAIRMWVPLRGADKYYMEEGGGFPWVRAVMSLVSLVSPGSFMACPSTEGAPESELTNLLVSLMQIRVIN
jgi:hypothetical protein